MEKIKDKLVLKFKASNVDEIEKTKGLSIENAIGDDTINNLALFIQKGLVKDDGTIGVSRAVAMDVIDEYLETHDKNELILDIMEGLINGGFLDRSLDVAKMRETMKKRATQVSEMIANS